MPPRRVFHLLLLLVFVSWSVPSLPVHGDVTIQQISYNNTLCSNSGSTNGAHTIYVDDANSLLYLSCYNGGVVSVSLATGATQILLTAAAGPTVNSIDFNPATGIIYASGQLPSDSLGGIVAISSPLMSALLTTCDNPDQVRVNSVTGEVYTICTGDAKIIAINTDQTTQAYQCASMSALDIDPLTNLVYTSCVDNGVSPSAISLRNGVFTTLSTDTFTCSGMYSIAVDPGTGVVYSSCSNSITSYAQGIASTVLSGSECLQPTLSISEATGILYAACLNSQSVIAMRGADVLVDLVSPGGCAYPRSVDLSHVDETAYVSCMNSNAVIAIDLNAAAAATTSSTTIGSLGSFSSTIHIDVAHIINSTVCASPSDVFIDDSTSSVYAACSSGSSGIVSTSLLTGATRVLATSTQCVSPTSVHVDSSTGIVYASCSSGALTYSSGGILSIGPSPSYTVAAIAACPNAQSVRVNSATGVVYAACADSTLIAIGTDGSVNQLVTAALCPNPTGVDVDITNNIVYAACQDSGAIISVTGWDPLSTSVVTTLSTDSTTCADPWSVAVDGATNVVYAACGSNSGVVAYSGGNQTVVATASQCPTPVGVTIGAATGHIYVACQDAGIIAIVGGSVVAKMADATTCASPNAISVSKQTGLAYTACSRGPTPTGVISVFASLVTSFGTGPCVPSGVSVQSASGAAFVRCQEWRNFEVSIIAIKGINPQPITSVASNSSDIGIGSAGAYILDGGSGALLRLNSNGDTITVGTVPCTAAGRTHIAVDDDRGRIYVTCRPRASAAAAPLPSLFVLVAGATTAVSAANGTVVPFAGPIAIDPVTGVVYVESAPKGVLALTLSVSGTGASATVTSTVTTAVPIANCSSVWDMTIDSTARLMRLTCATAVVAYNLTSSVVTTLSSPCNTASTPMWQLSSASSNGSATIVLCESGSPIAVSPLNSAVSLTTPVTSNTTCASGRQVRVDQTSGLAYLACADRGLVVVSTNFNCPPGLTFNSTGCIACAASTYRDPQQVASNTIGCALCPGGTISSAGAASCTPCAAGRYASNNTCVQCATGSYSSAGAAACSLCPAGSFCVGGVVTACPAGQYQNSTGQGNCIVCSVGYISPKNATSCALCPADTMASSGTLCMPCVYGSYSPAGSVYCQVAVASLALTAPTTVSQGGIVTLDAVVTANHGNVTASEITSIERSVTSILSASGDQLMPTADGYNATAAALVQSVNSGTLAQLSAALIQTIALSSQMSLSFSASILWANCTYSWRAVVTALLPAWFNSQSLNASSATTVQSICVTAWIPTAATITLPTTQMRRSESHTLAFTLVPNPCRSLPADATVEPHWTITDADDPTTTLLECLTAECTLPPLMMTIGRVYVSTLHLRLTRASTGDVARITSQTGFLPVASPLIAGFDAPTCDVDSGQPLILDAATHSYDPDDATRNATALTFRWQCRRLVTSSGTGTVTVASCALPSTIDVTSSSPLIPAHSLQSGVQYQFVVTVSTTDGRSAAHAALVTTTREYF